MLSTALILLSLHADAANDRGPIAVTVASKRPGADAFAAKVAGRVHSALVANGAAPALDDGASSKLIKKAGGDARACQGSTECLLKIAQQLGPRAVVIGVDVGKIGKNLAVHLEAVASDVHEPLAVAEFSAVADSLTEQTAEPISAFVKQVTERLAKLQVPSTPPVVAAKPTEDKPASTTRLAPQRTEPPPPAIVDTARPSSSRRYVAWGFTAGAVAAFATSGTFAILGMQERGYIDSNRVGDMTNLTQTEFDLHAGKGNTDFTIALATVIAGAVFGVVAGYFFATN